jgi:hypothetical protein
MTHTSRNGDMTSKYKYNGTELGGVRTEGDNGGQPIRLSIGGDAGREQKIETKEKCKSISQVSPCAYRRLQDDSQMRGYGQECMRAYLRFWRLDNGPDVSLAAATRLAEPLRP